MTPVTKHKQSHLTNKNFTRATAKTKSSHKMLLGVGVGLLAAMQVVMTTRTLSTSPQPRPAVEAVHFFSRLQRKKLAKMFGDGQAQGQGLPQRTNPHLVRLQDIGRDSAAYDDVQQYLQQVQQRGQEIQRYQTQPAGRSRLLGDSGSAAGPQKPLTPIPQIPAESYLGHLAQLEADQLPPESHTPAQKQWFLAQKQAEKEQLLASRPSLKIIGSGFKREANSVMNWQAYQPSGEEDEEELEEMRKDELKETVGFDQEQNHGGYWFVDGQGLKEWVQGLKEHSGLFGSCGEGQQGGYSFQSQSFNDWKETKVSLEKCQGAAGGAGASGGRFAAASFFGARPQTIAAAQQTPLSEADSQFLDQTVSKLAGKWSKIDVKGPEINVGGLKMQQLLLSDVDDLQAAQLQQAVETSGAPKQHLLIAIDVSASMSNPVNDPTQTQQHDPRSKIIVERLDLVKAAMESTIDSLNPNYYVSMMAFGNDIFQFPEQQEDPLWGIRPMIESEAVQLQRQTGWTLAQATKDVCQQFGIPGGELPPAVEQITVPGQYTQTYEDNFVKMDSQGKEMVKKWLLNLRAEGQTNVKQTIMDSMKLLAEKNRLIKNNQQRGEVFKHEFWIFTDGNPHPETKIQVEQQVAVAGGAGASQDDDDADDIDMLEFETQRVQQRDATEPLKKEVENMYQGDVQVLKELQGYQQKEVVTMRDARGGINPFLVSLQDGEIRGQCQRFVQETTAADLVLPFFGVKSYGFGKELKPQMLRDLSSWANAGNGKGGRFNYISDKNMVKFVFAHQLTGLLTEAKFIQQAELVMKIRVFKNGPVDFVDGSLSAEQKEQIEQEILAERFLSGQSSSQLTQSTPSQYKEQIKINFPQTQAQVQAFLANSDFAHQHIHDGQTAGNNNNNNILEIRLALPQLQYNQDLSFLFKAESPHNPQSSKMQIVEASIEYDLIGREHQQQEQQLFLAQKRVDAAFTYAENPSYQHFLSLKTDVVPQPKQESLVPIQLVPDLLRLTVVDQLIRAQRDIHSKLTTIKLSTVEGDEMQRFPELLIKQYERQLELFLKLWSSLGLTQEIWKRFIGAEELAQMTLLEQQGGTNIIPDSYVLDYSRLVPHPQVVQTAGVGSLSNELQSNTGAAGGGAAQHFLQRFGPKLITAAVKNNINNDEAQIYQLQLAYYGILFDLIDQHLLGAFKNEDQWSGWGEKYVLAWCDAQIDKFWSNGNDLGGQTYGGPVFRQVLRKTYQTITNSFEPMTQRSIKRLTAREQNAINAAVMGVDVRSLERAPVTDAERAERARLADAARLRQAARARQEYGGGGGCFGGDTVVRVQSRVFGKDNDNDNEEFGETRSITIDQVKAGDLVQVGNTHSNKKLMQQQQGNTNIDINDGTSVNVKPQFAKVRAVLVQKAPLDLDLEQGQGIEVVHYLDSGLKITPFHPIYDSGMEGWVFPQTQLEQQQKQNKSKRRIESTYLPVVYNLLLEEDAVEHTILIGNGNLNHVFSSDKGSASGDLPKQTTACTLGHGMESDNVIKHAYFGDYSKVLRDVERVEERERQIQQSGSSSSNPSQSQSSGSVEVGYFTRDPFSGLINGFRGVSEQELELEQGLNGEAGEEAAIFTV